MSDYEKMMDEWDKVPNGVNNDHALKLMELARLDRMAEALEEIASHLEEIGLVRSPYHIDGTNKNAP